MIKIDQTLISEDLLEEQFVCDLSKCKGMCCVEGDSGAPLEKDEKKTISKNLEKVKPYMNPAMVEHIEKKGFSEKDSDGDLVTQCPGGKACVFAIQREGVWMCSIEKAWEDGEADFQKPVSCHLYPVRLNELSGLTGVNYDRWEICNPACTLGKSLKVPVYKFVKEALIRKFGQDWYNKLELVASSREEEPSEH